LEKAEGWTQGFQQASSDLSGQRTAPAGIEYPWLVKKKATAEAVASGLSA
jgi:hypothetical protein